MLSNLFSLFHSSKSARAPTSRYRPSGITSEEHFNLLANLQISVRDESLQCVKPSAAEMLHGTNGSNLRKQVCAGCLFFPAIFFFLLSLFSPPPVRRRSQLLELGGGEHSSKACLEVFQICFSFLSLLNYPLSSFFSPIIPRNVTGADLNVIGPLVSNFCTKKLHFHPCPRENPHCKRTRAGH